MRNSSEKEEKMKRLILAVVLVAVLAAAVSGGIAMARGGDDWPRPPLHTSPTPGPPRAPSPSPTPLCGEEVCVEILTELGNVSAKLDDPAYGLEEIKAEIASIEAGLANVPVMETISGYGSASDDWVSIFDEFYPQVRHVSLTLLIQGIDTGGDSVGILMWFGPQTLYRDRVTTNGIKTYEFDTGNLQLDIWDFNRDPVEVWYYATMTYPRYSRFEAATEGQSKLWQTYSCSGC